MVLSRMQNVIVAFLIFILIVGFIISYIPDFLLMMIFIVLVFAALLRVVYQIVIPTEDESWKKKKAVKKRTVTDKGRPIDSKALTITIKERK